MMKAAVIPFRRPKTRSTDWTQAELAEFYRVEAALIATGMRVDTDRGLTDEGDPWFVFCHIDDEQDVIIHLARIGGSYLISAPGMGGAFSGSDFRELVRHLLAQHEAVAERRARKDNVVLHPSAMLWVLVAMAFLQSAEARAFGGEVPRGEALPPPPGPRSGETHDPVAALSAYALQPIMGAWGTTIGVLAAVELRPGGLQPSPDFGADAQANHVRAAPGADTLLAGAALTERPEHDAAAAPEAHLPAGSSAPAVAIAPATPAGEHPAAPLPAEAMPDLGAHGSPEPPVAPAVGADAVAVPDAGKEAIHLFAELNGAAALAAAVPAPLPDVLTGPLTHAVHLSGDPGEVMAKAAELQSAAAARPADATTGAALPAADGHAADAAATTAATAVIAAPAATLAATAGATTAAATTPEATAAGTTTPLATPAAPAQPAAAPLSEPQKLAAVLNMLQAFEQDTPGARALETSTSVVVYNSVAVAGDLRDVIALTFDFADGTHVSLVGLSTELTHLMNTFHP